jgi:hypothetical protein
VPALPEVGGLPAEATLTMISGDAWSRTLKLRRGSASGVPIDLTGCTITARICGALSGSVEANLPVTPINLAAGEVRIDISEAVSRSLQAGAFDRDPTGGHVMVIRLLDLSGETRTLLRIRMQVRGSC